MGEGERVGVFLAREFVRDKLAASLEEDGALSARCEAVQVRLEFQEGLVRRGLVESPLQPPEGSFLEFRLVLRMMMMMIIVEESVALRAETREVVLDALGLIFGLGA